MSKVLLSVSSSGLSNRLHAHASAVLLGPRLGREPRIHWPLTEQLSVQFKDMFTTEWPIINASELNHTLFRTERSAKIYNSADQFKIRPDDKEEIVMVKTWGHFCLAGDDVQEAKKEVVKVLRQLKPVAEVSLRVEALLSQVQQPFVGIHIRTCDMVGLHFCKAPNRGINRVNEVFAKTHTSFVEQARPWVEKGYGVFVCSDDVKHEQAVINSFPEVTVRQHKGVGWRETIDGMLEALVDLYTLAKAECVIGTKNSDFSILAAELGNGQLTVSQ